MAFYCLLSTIIALIAASAAVLGACTFVYRCIRAAYVLFVDLHVYLAPYISLYGSFLKMVPYGLGLRRFAVIAAMMLFVGASLLCARNYRNGLLHTIGDLRKQARVNSQAIAKRDHSLADCRTRLAEKTEAAKNVEKRVADARRSSERDLKERINSRLTIIRLEAQCSSMEPLLKEKAKANTEVKLLRRELAEARSTSTALRDSQVAASSKIEALEAEIEATPRWSDHNLVIFADLRSSNITLRRDVKDLTANSKETNTRLTDSLAANRKLRLSFDAERRAKEWLEILIGRRDEDVRAAEKRAFTTSTKLASTNTTLKSVEEQLRLNVEHVVRLEQDLNQLEQEKAVLVTNETNLRDVNTSLVVRVGELEACMGRDLLLDAQQATEAVAKQLEDSRQRNASLQALFTEKERVIKRLEQENVRARKEARISGEHHAGAEDRLAFVTADLLAIKQRAEALQAENSALSVDKTAAENCRDILLEENGQLTAQLVVKEPQDNEIRTELEVPLEPLQQQCEQWAQGVMQVANSAFRDQEQQIVALHEKPSATEVAMEELRRLTMELEYSALTSQMPAVFPSPPITPLAFFNCELQPAQYHPLVTGALPLTPQISVFPSPVAPQPFVPLAFGQSSVSVSNPPTYSGIAMGQDNQPTQTSATSGQGLQSTNVPGTSTAESTDLVTSAHRAPATAPQPRPLPGRREARALPRKFAGRVIQAPPSANLPAPPAPTSATSTFDVTAIQTPALSEPMPLPAWW